MKNLCIFLCFTMACTSSNKATKNKEKIKQTIASKSIKKQSQALKLPLTKNTAVPYLKSFAKSNQTDELRIKTKFGNIDVKLFKDTPLHSANFVFLTKQGYFNGVYFHRVTPDFVIQGGNSDEMKTVKKRHKIGSYRVPAEFTKRHLHRRGSLAAARKTDSIYNPEKMSSAYEFYIIHTPTDVSHLDFEYTVFGEVTQGMNVVDTIAKQPIDNKEWPIDNVVIKIETLN